MAHRFSAACGLSSESVWRFNKLVIWTIIELRERGNEARDNWKLGYAAQFLKKLWNFKRGEANQFSFKWKRIHTFSWWIRWSLGWYFPFQGSTKTACQYCFWTSRCYWNHWNDTRILRARYTEKKNTEKSNKSNQVIESWHWEWTAVCGGQIDKLNQRIHNEKAPNYCKFITLPFQHFCNWKNQLF